MQVSYNVTNVAHLWKVLLAKNLNMIQTFSTVKQH